MKIRCPNSPNSHFATPPSKNLSVWPQGVTLAAAVALCYLASSEAEASMPEQLVEAATKFKWRFAVDLQDPAHTHTDIFLQAITLVSRVWVGMDV